MKFERHQADRMESMSCVGLSFEFFCLLLQEFAKLLWIQTVDVSQCDDDVLFTDGSFNS